MNAPIVSIILPVFNGEKYIQECLESIILQTYKNWELIIINDGSNDSSDKLISKFINQIENQVQYLNLKSHKGLPHCLNLGIISAKGKYIARMDCDDVMIEDRLKKQVYYLEHHIDVGILGSKAVEIDEKGYEFGLIEIKTGDFNIKKDLTGVIHPSVMIRKEIINENYMYLEKYPYSEDFELWIRLSKITKFENLNEVLIKKRRHDEQLTQTQIKIRIRESLKLRLFYFLKTKYFPDIKVIIKLIILYVLPYPLLRKIRKQRLEVKRKIYNAHFLSR